jgi:hypothetical protein
MSAPLPPVAAVPAPGPSSLEGAFILARTAARSAADPVSVLRDASSTLQERLDALDALQDRIPGERGSAQDASLLALAAVSRAEAQPTAVRAKARALLGYAVPSVKSASARADALRALFEALVDPALRLSALRGLGPASHGLPPELEPQFETALLGFLDGPAAAEERETALVALVGFVSGGADMPVRSPQLLTVLDSRLLAPIEKDPAGFVRDPRSTPATRELEIAAAWIGARHRAAAGDPAPAARVKSLLVRLIPLEPDAGARAWYASYRDAAPPAPFSARTTSRAPGPDAP